MLTPDSDLDRIFQVLILVEDSLMSSVTPSAMSCGEAFVLIHKVNALYKTTAPADRLSAKDVLVAISHLKVCGVCQTVFPREVCQGGFISWVPANQFSDRALIHLLMHHCADIPLCVESAEIRRKLEARLSAATIQARRVALGADNESISSDGSTMS